MYELPMVAELVGQGQDSEDLLDPFALISPRWRRSTLGLFGTCAGKSGGLALSSRHLSHDRAFPKQTRGHGEFFGSRSPYSHTDQRRKARSHA